MKKIRLKDILHYWLEILASLCLVGCVLLVCANVFMRYVLGTGIYWTEEVTTSLFVWSVYLGAIVCYKTRSHVCVDMLVKLLPKPMANVVTLLVDFLLVLLNGYMAYVCAQYLKISYVKPTPVLNISSAYISSSLLICFVLTLYYSIKFLVQDAIAINKENKEEAEVC